MNYTNKMKSHCFSCLSIFTRALKDKAPNYFILRFYILPELEQVKP